MRDLYWLSEDQLARIEPFFPLAHGMPRVDDRRVIFVLVEFELTYCKTAESFHLT